MHSPSPTPATNPVLLDVQAVASICGCSTRTVYRLADAGKMPRPYKIAPVQVASCPNRVMDCRRLPGL